MGKKLYTENPFELFHYNGPEYFCDREEELEKLISAFDNKVNSVLSSYRRLGKTSLIMHLHHYLSKRKNVICVYLDILHTNSDQDFMEVFVNAVLKELDKKEAYLVQFLQGFKKLRPTAGVDPISGTPTLSMNIASNEDLKHSFDTIMEMILNRHEKFQITIDEFQEISNYPAGTKIDALLRSYYPKAANLHFIFSGSDQSLLNTLFSNPKKPMFASTQMIKLGFISYPKYFEFIKHHFENAGKKISDIIIHRILKWTRQYTFYTHFLSNNLFVNTGKIVTDTDLEISMNSCLKHFEEAYYFYERVLTANQFNMLIAIAKENDAKKILSKNFLNKYKFSASSAKLALKKLVDDHLVHERYDEEGHSYFVYDVFMMRWLENRKLKVT